MKRTFRKAKKGRIGFFERNPRNRILAELLRATGFEVLFPVDTAAGLSAKDIDLWITCVTNRAEARGAEELRKARPQAPLVALVTRSSRAVMGRCKNLRAQETVHLDQAAALGEVLDVVAELLGQDANVDPRFDGPRSNARTYEADEAGTNNAAYELAAFLTERGVVHPHRIRIVSAVYEAMDNARRHAYPDRPGSISLEVELDRMRVFVSVQDRGIGFDSSRVLTDYVPAALPTRGTEQSEPTGVSHGLVRLAALTEEHDVQSDPQGTRVEMVFELTPVRFEEEPDDLTDVDFLNPERARQLVQSLKDGSDDFGDIAPALALTVGRLLGAQRGLQSQ